MPNFDKAIDDWLTRDHYSSLDFYYTYGYLTDQEETEQNEED